MLLGRGYVLYANLLPFLLCWPCSADPFVNADIVLRPSTSTPTPETPILTLLCLRHPTYTPSPSLDVARMLPLPIAPTVHLVAYRSHRRCQQTSPSPSPRLTTKMRRLQKRSWPQAARARLRRPSPPLAASHRCCLHLPRRRHP